MRGLGSHPEGAQGNTLLRNKAVRGKSFFVKKSFGDQAHADYTPQQLLRMGKQGMTRVLCAYETNLPRVPSRGCAGHIGIE